MLRCLYSLAECLIMPLLCLTPTISTPPGSHLWHLSRFWAIDEPLTASICNYGVVNGASASPLLVWDAFKLWARGEYISHIAHLQKEASHSLDELEEKATRLETAYVSNWDWDLAWWHVLCNLSTSRVHQTNKALLYSSQKVFEYWDKNCRLLAWLAGDRSQLHL